MRSSYENLSAEARNQLKIRILDSLGCAIGALDGEPVCKVRSLVEELGGGGRCALIGGGFGSPDRAALLNCALVRYLDFNDSYFSRGETCHPSDNLGAAQAANAIAISGTAYNALRRADLRRGGHRPGRVDPGADPQPARRAEARVPPDHPVHRPRSHGRLLHGRPHRSALRGQPHGRGPRLRDRAPAPAPLYPAALPVDIQARG